MPADDYKVVIRADKIPVVNTDDYSWRTIITRVIQFLVAQMVTFIDSRKLIAPTTDCYIRFCFDEETNKKVNAMNYVVSICIYMRKSKPNAFFTFD